MKQSLTLFPLWWLPSSSLWCECHCLQVPWLSVYVRTTVFWKKIGCCIALEGSLKYFSYAHSKTSLFPLPFAVLLEVKMLKTEETGACCVLFILLYTWHWCSDSTSMKPLWGLKLFPDKMTVMALHLQWLENALSLTLRSWVTSLSLLAWAFLGQRLFA